jgi:hypothetical protein
MIRGIVWNCAIEHDIPIERPILLLDRNGDIHENRVYEALWEGQEREWKYAVREENITHWAWPTLRPVHIDGKPRETLMTFLTSLFERITHV